MYCKFCGKATDNEKDTCDTCKNEQIGGLAFKQMASAEREFNILYLDQLRQAEYSYHKCREKVSNLEKK